jgi:catechol O-methyltransferase
VILDHSKISYLNDLKLCKELGLVSPGTIIMPDGMYYLGNPAYSEYVRGSTQSKIKARMPCVGRVSNGGPSLGNLFLIYESTTFEGLEPTGLPVRIFLVFQSCS